MRRLTPLGLLLACGCLHAPAESPALAPIPVDRNLYRGMEGYRGVLWGTPIGEVRAGMPDAHLVDQGILVRSELVDGRAGKAFYFFADGHLARVVVSYSPEAAGAAEQVRAELTRALGRPALARSAAADRRDEEGRPRFNDQQLEMFMVLAALTASAVAEGGVPDLGLLGTGSALDRTPPASSSATSSGDFAYARWLTHESVVEWLAHPTSPASLTTAFSSRVMTEP